MELELFLQLLFDFLSKNWIAILSLFISSVSLLFYVKGYRYKTRGKVKVKVTKAWDFELEEETLDDGSVTAIIKKSDDKTISLKNVGGAGTTLKAIKIVKKRRIPLKSLKRAEVAWRKQAFLTRIDGKGNLVQLSIWSKIEPGERVNLLLLYVTLLDVMLDNSMLDLKNKYQGRFALLIEHVFGEAKSDVFPANLSDNLRRFISERQKTFARIIAKDVSENEL